MSAIYTLAFRAADTEGYGRASELRLEAACNAVATIAAADPVALIALPAGFLYAASASQRDAWAEALLSTTRSDGAALVFGIDVVEEETWEGACRPRSFLYACDRGRRLLWAARPADGLQPPMTDRLLTLAGRRMLLLLGCEVFRASTRTAAARHGPDLAIVLAHGGATRRWLPALAALDRLVPTLVVRDDLPGRRAVWTAAPRGWQVDAGASTALLAVQRLSSLAVGETGPAVGH